jgi:WD40 repeat protein
MARYDRVLIDPSRDELFASLREAVEAANEKRRLRLVSWPLPGVTDVYNQLSEPHGWHQWNGGQGPARSGEGRSAVVLAWWTDRAGRKHHRIVGRHGAFNRPLLENLLCPFGDPRPPLWFVYPDHIFLKRQGGHRVAQAICACGAHGTPEELGWMGPCCDSCHDRGVEGQEATQAWLDPKLATLQGQEGRLTFLAYSPDSKILAAGTGRDEVTLWDTTTGLERGRLVAKDDEWLLTVGWIDDGQRLVTGDVGGLLRYWSARTGLPTGVEVKTGSTAECFAVSGDGSVICRSNRSRTLLLSSHDGQPIRDLEGTLPDVGSLAFSPDGRWLAGGSRHGAVAVWDVQTGKLRSRFDRHGAIIAGLAFSPTNRSLAVALLPAPGSSSPEASRVLLWDVVSREQTATLPGHANGTRCVGFAPDGRILASGGEDGLVRLWDTNTGEERIGLEWHLDTVCSVAFAPDGMTLASGSFDGTVKLWPREILRPVRRLQGAVQ